MLGDLFTVEGDVMEKERLFIFSKGGLGLLCYFPPVVHTSSCLRMEANPNRVCQVHVPYFWCLSDVCVHSIDPSSCHRKRGKGLHYLDNGGRSSLDVISPQSGYHYQGKKGGGFVLREGSLLFFMTRTVGRWWLMEGWLMEGGRYNHHYSHHHHRRCVV